MAARNLRAQGVMRLRTVRSPGGTRLFTRAHFRIPPDPRVRARLRARVREIQREHDEEYDEDYQFYMNLLIELKGTFALDRPIDRPEPQLPGEPPRVDFLMANLRNRYVELQPLPWSVEAYGDAQRARHVPYAENAVYLWRQYVEALRFELMDFWAGEDTPTKRVRIRTLVDRLKDVLGNSYTQNRVIYTRWVLGGRVPGRF